MTRIVHLLGHGWAGKSVIALNLGAALARRGRRCILLDANLRSPDLTHYAGVRHPSALNDLLDDAKTVADALYQHEAGMHVIGAHAEEHDADRLGKVNDVLLQLHGHGEIVLVDTHSLHGLETLHGTDEALVVTSDDFHSISKTRDLIDALEKQGISITGAVLNRKRRATTLHHVSRILGKPLLVALPYDEDVIDSINQQQLFYHLRPQTEFTRGLDELSHLLDHVD